MMSIWTTALRLTACLGFWCLALGVSSAAAQGIEVAPANIALTPGQLAASLSITNHNDRKISFQIRVFDWQQDSQGGETLSPTDDLLFSPPLATIEPGRTQIVRLVLRRPPQGSERTYRILFDQLPPPAEPGVVQVLIRLSIPIFASPQGRTTPQIRWRVTTEGNRHWLIASNGGTRHLSVRDLKLYAPDGRLLRVEMNSPPHILAGATRRWPIVTNIPLHSEEVLRLAADADTGAIDERISVEAGPVEAGP
jgi:fimbrial chaperone protein